MRVDQKFTPKYWVLNDKTGTDVYLQTASKTYDACWSLADNTVTGWWDDENFEIILVEIRMLVIS